MRKCCTAHYKAAAAATNSWKLELCKKLDPKFTFSFEVSTHRLQKVTKGNTRWCFFHFFPFFTVFFPGFFAPAFLAADFFAAGFSFAEDFGFVTFVAFFAFLAAAVAGFF